MAPVIDRIATLVQREAAKDAREAVLSVLDAVCAEFDCCHDADRQVYGAGHVAAEVRRRLREGEPVRMGHCRPAPSPLRPMTPAEAEAAYDAAPEVPVSEERVKEIVEYATRERPPVPLCAWCSRPLQECLCDGEG